MSQLKDKLDIFIITYNREKELGKTLAQLYSETSPVKDFYITVLDNASTDGTETLCKSYAQNHPKFKYIKNNRNIGAVLNVIKAMELANKEWYWILGDDDNYNWDAWAEIEDALNCDKYEAVYTCWHDGAKSIEYRYLLNEAGFLATAIIKTQNLTSTVMQNAGYVSLSMDPHCAPIAKIINEKGNIYIPYQKLVLENMCKNFSYIKSKDEQLHPDIRNHNIIYSKLRVYQLLINKNLRYESNEILCLGSDFISSMNFMLDIGLDLKRLVEVLFMLNLRQKLVLLWIIIVRKLKKFFSIHAIWKMEKTEKKRHLTILGIKITTNRKKEKI